MDRMDFFWLGVIILAAVIEAAVPGLVAVWFVPGGVAALIASLLGGPLWLQVLLFLAVSAAALAATRPLARRMQEKRAASTNADRVIGKQALVTQEIDNLAAAGRVQVLGNSWAARSEDGQPVPKGETVIVKGIEGVKLIVSR